MNIESSWQEPTNPTLLNVISTATSGIQKYHDNPDRAGYEPTLPWRAAAQLGVLNWIREYHPDAEDLRSSLETIAHDGNNFGCSSFEFTLVTHCNETQLVDDPAHHQLLIAKETRIADSLGARHFGDSLVVIPHEFGDSIPRGDKDRGWYLAHSNGCAKPRNYLARIEAEGLTIPSMAYQPHVAPEINHYFDRLPAALQVFVWDYARCNKLFQYLAEVISRENQSLFYELMHRREEMPDNDEALLSLPRKVDGKRQVRFIALSHPYPVIATTWKIFDEHCKNGNHELAEQTFDTNVTHLTNLAMRASTLAELESKFLASIE